MSNSLQPHGLQHARLPCPSLSPGSLLQLMSIESVMPSNHLILCHPLFLLPSIFPSITVFSNELALRIRWPKFWSFSISPSKEYSGLIPLKTDFFDLFAVHFPIPQFEGINSLVLCFLYSPGLTTLRVHLGRT